MSSNEIMGGHYDMEAGFTINLVRYSDPERLNLARNAAIYLGKSDRDNIRRPLSIIKNGHVPEIFRGEHAEFEFVGVSKEVYDHLTTYTTRTMRVAGGNRALRSEGYMLPSDKMKDPEFVELMIERSMESYERLNERGETPQVARSAMPPSARMNPFVLQFNFLTMMESLFRQRIWEKGAQGNTVRVVRAMFDLVHNVDPGLWDAAYKWFGLPATEWRQSRLALQRLDVAELVKRLNGLGIDRAHDNAEETIRELFGDSKSMWDN